MMPENDNVSISAPKLAPLTRQNLALLVAVLALLVAGWQWFETRQRLVETEQGVTRRLAEAAAANQEERGAQKQLREQLEALQGKLGAFESKLDGYENQSATLQTLYENIARSREEATLLEVEQAITLAGQQLQLAGNVPVAILALQTADVRLARLDQARTLPLRKALAKDLERLTALPFVDVPGISLRLEQIIVSVDQWPLASDGRPSAKAENDKTADTPWWQRTGSEIWQELKDLVRIQRFDREEPPLLAPGQAFFLRENLKLRLLNARLALLSREHAIFRSELKAASDALGRYFDTRDKRVQGDQAILKQLLAGETDIQAPDLGATQAALRTLRDGKDRK